MRICAGAGARSDPAEFARFIGEEPEKWAKVVKISGAKPE